MLITPLLLLLLPLARNCASVVTDPNIDRFGDLSRHRASEENLANSARRFQASEDRSRAISKLRGYEKDRSIRLHGIKPKHESRVGSLNSEPEDQQKLVDEERKQSPVSRTEKLLESWKSQHNVSSSFRNGHSIPQVNAKGLVRLGEDRGELRRRWAKPQPWHKSTISALPAAAVENLAGQDEEDNPEQTPEHTSSPLNEVPKSITTPSASEPTPTPPSAHSSSPALTATPAASRAASGHRVSRTYVDAQATATAKALNKVSSKFGAEDPLGNKDHPAGDNCWIPSRCRPGKEADLAYGLHIAQGTIHGGTTGRNAVKSIIPGHGAGSLRTGSPGVPVVHDGSWGSGTRKPLPTGYRFSNISGGHLNITRLQYNEGPAVKVPKGRLVPLGEVDPHGDKGATVKTPGDGLVSPVDVDTKGQRMSPGKEGDPSRETFRPTNFELKSRLDGLDFPHGIGFFLQPTKFDGAGTDGPAPTASAFSYEEWIRAVDAGKSAEQKARDDLMFMYIKDKDRADRLTDPHEATTGSEHIDGQPNSSGSPAQGDLSLPDTGTPSDRPQPSSQPENKDQRPSQNGESNGGRNTDGEQTQGSFRFQSTNQDARFQQGATFKSQFFQESANADLVPPGADANTGQEPAPKGAGGSEDKGQNKNPQPSQGATPNTVPLTANASKQPSSGDDKTLENGGADGSGKAKPIPFNPHGPPRDLKQVFKAENTAENATLVPLSGSEKSSSPGSQPNQGQPSSDSTPPPADEKDIPNTANSRPNFSGNQFTESLFRGGAVQPVAGGSNPDPQRQGSGDTSRVAPSLKSLKPPDSALVDEKESSTKKLPAKEDGRAPAGDRGGNPSSQAEEAQPSDPNPASSGIESYALGRPSSGQPSTGVTEQGNTSLSSDNPGSSPPQGATPNQKENQGAAGNGISNFDNNQITGPIVDTRPEDDGVSSDTPNGGQSPAKPPLVNGEAVQKATNGDVEVGSVRIPEGKSAIVEGHTISNVPAAVGIDGQDIPLPLAVSTDSFVGSAPSINDQPIERLPNGNLQIGSTTIPPDTQQQVQGHVLANNPSAAVLDGSTYSYSSTPTPSPPTIGGQPIERKPDGALIIGSTTIAPGKQAEVSGHTISNFPAAAVIDGDPFPISATSSNPPLPLLDGQQVRKDDKDNLIIGSTTIAPTAASLLGGFTISNVPSGALIDGTTYAATTPGPGQATPVLGPIPPASISKLPIYEFMTPSATQVLNAELPGGIPAGTDLLTLAPPTATDSHMARLAIAGTPVRALPSASGAVAIGTATIAPGQETTIAGVPVSLGTSDIKVDGTQFRFVPSQIATGTVAAPTITTAPGVLFDLKTNGDAFTIPVPQGEGVDVEALSAALPGANVSVDTMAREVVVSGFRLPGAAIGTVNLKDGYGNGTRVVEEGISSSVDAAFTPTASPTAGAGRGAGEELLVLVPNEMGGVDGFGSGAVLTSTIVAGPTLTTMVTSLIGTDGSVTGAYTGVATAEGTETGSAGTKLGISRLRLLLLVVSCFWMVN